LYPKKLEFSKKITIFVPENKKNKTYRVLDSDIERDVGILYFVAKTEKSIKK
jgi:hypothetical protein